MRIPCFLLFAALAGPVAAQPAAVAPWMTGARLLKLLEQTNAADIAWAPGGVFATRQLQAEHRDQLNRQFVDGYIHAAHDATEGRAWCYSRKYKPKPSVLIDDALAGLRALPPDQLQRNAAALLAEIWAAKWPCPDRR